MSKFKTKKLSIKEPVLSPKSEEIVIEKTKKKWFSYKIIIALGILILSLFFVVQVATKAFQ